MNMQDVLAKLIISDPGISEMVGDRVDWDVSSQGATGPRIIMFLISALPGYTMTGRAGHHEERIQFDCRANTARERRELSQRLEAFLSGYRGTFAGIEFQGCFKRAERSRYDKDGATGWFQSQIDYEIWWQHAAGASAA